MYDATSPLLLRPFRLSDAGIIEPWLTQVGWHVGARGGSASGHPVWTDRLMRDQRILALVALRADQQVGLVRLDCGPDGVAELTMIVAPQWRRSGQGRRMFDAALMHARSVGLRRLVVYVELENEAALAFFGEMGFEAAGAIGGRIRMDRMVHNSGRVSPLDVGI